MCSVYIYIYIYIYGRPERNCLKDGIQTGEKTNIISNSTKT